MFVPNDPNKISYNDNSIQAPMLCFQNVPAYFATAVSYKRKEFINWHLLNLQLAVTVGKVDSLVVPEKSLKEKHFWINT
jgi:hypothetical protein